MNDIFAVLPIHKSPFVQFAPSYTWSLEEGECLGANFLPTWLGNKRWIGWIIGLKNCRVVQQWTRCVGLLSMHSAVRWNSRFTCS